MMRNMGAIDRIIRLSITAIIVVLYFFGTLSGAIGIPVGVVAIVLLITGLVGWCPVYTLFGASTKGK